MERTLARLLMALLVMIAAHSDAQPTCQVDLGRGWSTGVGKGRMVMSNTGAGCSAALVAVPEAGIPVDDIELVNRPRHGIVAMAPPRFTYTPAPGFKGVDTFSLSARGAGRDGRPVHLRGEVTVEVRWLALGARLPFLFGFAQVVGLVAFERILGLLCRRFGGPGFHVAPDALAISPVGAAVPLALVLQLIVLR